MIYVKNKIAFPKLAILPLIISFALFCFKVAIYLFENSGTYIYTSAFDAFDVLFVVDILSSCLFVFGAIIFVHRNINKKIVKIILIILIVLVSLVAWFLSVFKAALSHLDHYVELNSDDGRYQIIVGDKAFLFSGGGYIYQKDSPFTMKMISMYDVVYDDYAPFLDGDYDIVWEEDFCEIHYDYSGDGDNYKTIIVEYLKKKSPWLIPR